MKIRDFEHDDQCSDSSESESEEEVASPVRHVTLKDLYTELFIKENNELYYASFCHEAEDDIDEIDMTNIITFNWIPDPSRYHSGDTTKQYEMLLTHILLSAPKYFSKFCFVPELTKAGNVHMHGWYIIKDKIAYYKMFLPKCKELGHVLNKDNSRNPKTVDRSWFTYCRKEIDITSGIINDELPIPLTHYNCGDYKCCYKPSVLKLRPRRLSKSMYNYLEKRLSYKCNKRH